MAEFASMLKDLRKRAGLTQEDLAEQANVAVRTISDLERGVSHIPQKETARRLADALALAGLARDRFVSTARGRPPAGRLAETDLPTVSGVAPTTRMLPRSIASFTGRRSELQHVLEAAAGAAAPQGVVRICAIEGMAGVGKTSLALRAGHLVADRYPDGQLFLDLHGFTDGLDPLSAGEGLGALLRSLGIPPQLIPEDVAERAAFYRSRLAGTRTLVILDNAASTPQVEPLLPGTAGCLVIVTSRRRLHGLDDAFRVALDVLPEQDAVALFRAVAGPEHISARAPDLAEIVALCGYLPLAIRITAARLSYRKSKSVENLAATLRHEQGRLAHLQDEDRDLTAVFGLSYRHLPEPEQHMFRHLGLVPGPDFDAYAAANLADLELDLAEQLLDSLLDHNLLIQRASGRYRLHDLVRAYARTLVPESIISGPASALADDESSTFATAVGRLLDYYLHTAQSADRNLERRIVHADQPVIWAAPRAKRRLGTSGLAQAWISAELGNLDAAAQYAADHRRQGYAVALSAALAQYLRVHGPWSQAASLHLRALRAAQDSGDLDGQASALTCLGSTQWQTGAFQPAEDTLHRALALYRDLGNRQGQAGVLTELAMLHRLTGEYVRADQRLRQALALHRELGNRNGEAGCLAELGLVQRQKGQFTLAIETLTQALIIYRATGNRYGQGATLNYLASVQCSTGAFDQAAEAVTRSLTLHRELGDRYGQANAFMYLGMVQKEAGTNARAKETLMRAMSLYDELGDRRAKAGALTYLGAVQTLTAEYGDAAGSLTEAVQLFGELRDRGGEAEARNYYATLIMATETPASARVQYRRALRLSREIKSGKDEADALEGIAVSYRSEGNARDARTYFRKALERYGSIGCAIDVVRVRSSLDRLENA